MQGKQPIKGLNPEFIKNSYISEKDNPNRKMDKSFEKILHKKRHLNSQYNYEKLLKHISHSAEMQIKTTIMYSLELLELRNLAI